MQGYAKWRATQGVVTSAAVEEVRKQHGDILAEVESVMAGFQSRFGVVPEPEPETVHDLLARGETPTYKLVEGRRVFEASFSSPSLSSAGPGGRSRSPSVSSRRSRLSTSPSPSPSVAQEVARPTA